MTSRLIKSLSAKSDKFASVDRRVLLVVDVSTRHTTRTVETIDAIALSLSRAYALWPVSPAADY